MRLVPHPDAAVLALTGRLAARRLELTAAERQTLARARIICDQAAYLLGETLAGEGSFLDAEARLAEVLA